MPAEVELQRVLPVIAGLAADGIAVSIDTSKAEVAQAALAAGAVLVNDVTALRGDPAMASVVAEAGADLCLMHMLGEPRTMQDDPRYDDVGPRSSFLAERAEAAVAAGVPEERIALDPGIGFGKTLAHNLALLRRCRASRGSARCCWASRASASWARSPAASRRRPRRRLVAAALYCYRGGAALLRVHDVAPRRTRSP